MIIFQSNSCNYTCVMCPNKDLEPGDRGLMDFDLFKKTVDEAREFIFDANMNHRGESLLHPRLVEMLEVVKSAGLFARLHTNGSLLTEELSRGIILSGLDRLSFSFDGYDKKTYEKIRRGGDFEKTVENIVRFLEIKKELGRKKPVTVIEVIDFQEGDPRELAEAKAKYLSLFEGLPLDSLVIKEFHNWAGEVGPKKPLAKKTTCAFPWNGLIIFWDGSVLPCTQDFFGSLKLGNIRESSIKEIWNNERMIDLRRRLARLDTESLGVCAKCDRLAQERILGIPKGYVWRFLTKRMP